MAAWRAAAVRFNKETETWSGSATDLANHARCSFLTQLTRNEVKEIAEGKREREEPSSLLMEKGQEHEARIVSDLRSELDSADDFVDVCAVVAADRVRQKEVLQQAMKDGVRLIAQAPLQFGAIFGYADLLERQSDGSYEPIEIKYSGTVKPEHVLQVAAYTAALRELSPDHPTQRMHVIDGNGERHSFYADEYLEYLATIESRFNVAIQSDLEQELAQTPEPTSYCAECRFKSDCDERWARVDHLSLVARIRGDQRKKMAALGIHTVADLADTELESVPGINREVYRRLRTQASLQKQAERAGKAPVRYREPMEVATSGGRTKRGFALLPEPDALDMFFDFEGYPYHEAGGLEYLWGWTTQKPRTETDALRPAASETSAQTSERRDLAFDYLWASDPEEEGAAFTAFLDEVYRRLEQSPGMHVYHYAPYEITALRRLARIHSDEASRLDHLLRIGVFIDLYAVVREALLIGVPSYSIKKLEPLYGVSREDDDLADGGASITVFEEWFASRSESLKQTIIDYNRVDCDSTLFLRDWLLEHKKTALDQGFDWEATATIVEQQAVVQSAEDEAEQAEKRAEARRTIERLRALASDESVSSEYQQIARLLEPMLGWGRRISREFFGELYANARDREVDDFLLDAKAVAGLSYLDIEDVKRGTFLRTYGFPEQVTLASEKQDVLDAFEVEKIGTVEAVDYDARRLTIRTTKRLSHYFANGGHPEAVITYSNIHYGDLESVAWDMVRALINAVDEGLDVFALGHPYAAAFGLLAQRKTRVTEGAGPGALSQNVSPGGISGLVKRAEGSYVILQGPPGTGKTYTSSRVIVDLLEAGMRVGISSNSRSAIINVLRGIDEYQKEREEAGNPCRFLGAYHRSGPKIGLGFGEDWLKVAKNHDELADADLIAGTAWMFARGHSCDAVLIDEAGQVSLLHLVAITHNAKRVVLVGDPQQLPQPSEVTHPNGCDASALEHLFRGESVLPEDEAVLLNTTYRMHPDITAFISSAYYRNRLTSHPSTSGQYVRAEGLPASGVVPVLIDHTGNRIHSAEEVDAIREIVDDLLESGRVVAKGGEEERAITPDDIIVVAPYNAQRRALSVALGDKIEVGTVDKFQGREAAIAILSLTASSREDLPRGLEFLLSPNRMNVAISRARALAVVVASRELVATSAKSIPEMRMLNDLARVVKRDRPPI